VSFRLRGRFRARTGPGLHGELRTACAFAAGRRNVAGHPEGPIQHRAPTPGISFRIRAGPAHPRIILPRSRAKCAFRGRKFSERLPHRPGANGHRPDPRGRILGLGFFFLFGSAAPWNRGRRPLPSAWTHRGRPQAVVDSTESRENSVPLAGTTNVNDGGVRVIDDCRPFSRARGGTRVFWRFWRHGRLRWLGGSSSVIDSNPDFSRPHIDLELLANRAQKLPG